jgi:hypothetical protein
MSIESRPSPGIAKPAALREGYIARLRRLLRLRKQHEGELNEQGLRLLDRAIFSAYCDCRDAGLHDQAVALLEEARFSLAPSLDDRPDRSSTASA